MNKGDNEDDGKKILSFPSGLKMPSIPKKPSIAEEVTAILKDGFEDAEVENNQKDTSAIISRNTKVIAFNVLVIMALVVFLGWSYTNHQTPSVSASIEREPASEPDNNLPKDIASYLENVAVKRLSATEIDQTVSNQHEINGVSSLRLLFGKEKQSFRARFVYYGDKTFSTDSELTWYDAARDPNDERFRLYYQDNPVIRAAKPGDAIVIAQYAQDSILAIIAPQASAYEQHVFELLNIPAEVPRGGVHVSQSEGQVVKLSKVANAEDTKATSDMIKRQLQQTGKVPIDIALWRDVGTGEVTISGEVTKVKDGDGLHIEDKLFNIRLYGVDAFEKKQTCLRGGKQWNCGKEAHQLLSKLALGKKVRCTNKKKEKYGRFLSVCEVGGQNLNELLIKKGLAVIYYSDEYAELEKQTRLNKAGLWQDGVKYINPSDWRKGERLDALN